MMDITQWFKDYLAKNAPCQCGGEDGAVLAAIDLYRATGDEAFRAFALEHGVCPSSHADQALFFLWAQTGEDNDRQAIEQRMQQLRGTVPENGKMLYAAGPFCMAYEMKCGGMEKVAAVVQMYKAPMQLDGWRLLALADAIGWCREELYEHYRALVDLFRAELATVLQQEESAQAACAVMKAVRLGVINPEKYLPIGKKLFEKLPLPGDEKAIGPYIRAYSEYLQA